MITFIFILITTLLLVLQALFEWVWPFALFLILILVLLIAIKVRKQCVYFGKENVFRMTYTGKKIDIEDYVFMMLMQVPKKHFIEKFGHFIIYFCESGIYLFVCFKEKGIVTGSIEDEILTCSRGKSKVFIYNPLSSFMRQKRDLETYLDCSISPYLVVENHCQFLVKENMIPFIFLKNVYYDFLKKKEKLYTDEQLVMYHQKIVQYVKENHL